MSHTYEPVKLGISGTLATIMWGLWAYWRQPASSPVPKHRNGYYAWISIALCLACMVSVIVTQWPVRLAFVVSRPSLECLAERIESGQVVVQPQRAGLFLIRSAGIRPGGVVYLWTDPDPGAPIGFVRCSRDQLQTCVNTWFSISMSEEWQLVFAD
jgi:hypothetical protein